MIHSSLCSLGRYRNSRCDTATHRCGFTGRQRRKKKSIQTLAVEIMSSHRTFSSKSDVGLMYQRLTLQLSTVYFFLLLYHFQGHGWRTGGLKSITAFIWWRPGSPRNSVLVYHRATCRDRKQIVLDGCCGGNQRKPRFTQGEQANAIPKDSYHPGLTDGQSINHWGTMRPIVVNVRVNVSLSLCSSAGPLFRGMTHLLPDVNWE